MLICENLGNKVQVNALLNKWEFLLSYSISNSILYKGKGRGNPKRSSLNALNAALSQDEDHPIHRSHLL